MVPAGVSRAAGTQQLQGVIGHGWRCGFFTRKRVFAYNLSPCSGGKRSLEQGKGALAEDSQETVWGAVLGSCSTLDATLG